MKTYSYFEVKEKVLIRRNSYYLQKIVWFILSFLIALTIFFSLYYFGLLERESTNGIILALLFMATLYFISVVLIGCKITEIKEKKAEYSEKEFTEIMLAADFLDDDDHDE